MNFALKSRYYLYQDAAFRLEQRQLDVVHFSTFKLNYKYNISFGLQYRNRDVFSDSSNEFRTTQQFNYLKQPFGARFGHRFRTEQRFLDAETIFRQRYRFAVDFPLNGEKLDIGEAYYVCSVEALLSLSNINAPELDQRTTAQIGWQLTENLKLQTGLEYRLEALNINTQNKLFILTSAVLKI
ncbi:MAG: DUF2490 domain-containing protein [Flavobacteriales bacterium]|nr:DUF2490 domain-containing protein [Flavobacteriia bacterium]NCP05519.1 DUF2490 domain-containing protein [Flavobacteriales bacterium]NCP51632.1 DUF2490 domain-containing protein [Flavobacteriales bacterium]NCP59697.1 DUF2490 domain-containing protein [Flavobacteriales bacterium]NCQ14173.1 DUF2490 domain-containing protein [Flavobacteriales bacterium]